MNVGELRTKINLCKKVVAEGPIQSIEPSYEVVKQDIWAKKIMLLGKESIKTGIEHNTVIVNFIIRSRNDIAEDLFIKHQNTIYNIIGFEELKDDRNFMLITTVKK